MGLVAVFKRQPFFVSGSVVHFTGSEEHKFSKKCRYCMFHIFVALPDLYIVLFHIIKTYSSFWINDIYGIYIEFVILPLISKKSSDLVALAVQIRVGQSFRFSFLQSWVITIYLPWLCCVVWTFLFRSKTSI